MSKVQKGMVLKMVNYLVFLDTDRSTVSGFIRNKYDTQANVTFHYLQYWLIVVWWMKYNDFKKNLFLTPTNISIDM